MASNNNSYYICSPYNTPQLLRTSGEEPIELTISYLYELDVVEALSSFDLAVQQVSSTVLHRIATISNLADCSTNSEDDAPFRQLRQRERSLRYKGRGSTSLIGIASNESTIKLDQVCQFQLSGGEINEINNQGVQQQFIDEEEGENNNNNIVTGDFSGSVLEAEQDSQQQQLQGERPTTTTEEEDNTTTNNVLAVTRVDGVVDPSSVILRSAPIPTNQLEEIKEEGEENDGAYNYLSTQSKIKEAESSRTQPDNNVSLRQSNVVISSAPPKLRSGGTSEAPPGTKCNVVQGQITLFISNTADLSFENLDGRILETIKDDLNNEVLLQDEFLKDGIVGLRLLEPSMMVVEDEDGSSRVPPSSPLTPTISVATPSVTAETTAAASSSSSSPSNLNEAAPTSSTGFASSTASIGVIGSLAAIFLMLIGLFAYTSRPRKRRRYRLGDGDEDDLKSAHEIYENELDAVSAVMSGNDAASLWWQEPIRMTDSFDSRSIMEATVPTVEACYSNKGVIISNDDIDEAFADNDNDASPKKLPLSFFNRKSNKSRDEIMEDGTSNLVAGELIKSDSLFDADESTVDMDAHLFNGVEKSKKSKSLRRLFGRKRTAADITEDVIIDEDIGIQDIQSQEAETETNEVLIHESYSQDQFGIETTRTAPLRPMEAYVSPTTIRSRSRLSEEDYAERILQTCSSGGLSSCIPYDLPAPEIGDEQSNISALTDNFSRRGPGCAVTECVAPTDDASVPTSVSMKQQKQQKQKQQQQQQLARRQANMDSFADCWNPFEGDFWQGWFD